MTKIGSNSSSNSLGKRMDFNKQHSKEQTNSQNIHTIIQFLSFLLPFPSSVHSSYYYSVQAVLVAYHSHTHNLFHSVEHVVGTNVVVVLELEESVEEWAEDMRIDLNAYKKRVDLALVASDYQP